jgi:hypothetical protein
VRLAIIEEYLTADYIPVNRQLRSCPQAACFGIAEVRRPPEVSLQEVPADRSAVSNGQRVVAINVGCYSEMRRRFARGRTAGFAGRAEPVWRRQ